MRLLRMANYKLRVYQTTERSEARRWIGILLEEDGAELMGEWSRVYGPDKETVIRKAQAVVDKQKAYWNVRGETEEIIELN